MITLIFTPDDAKNYNIITMSKADCDDMTVESLYYMFDEFAKSIGYSEEQIDCVYTEFSKYLIKKDK